MSCLCLYIDLGKQTWLQQIQKRQWRNKRVWSKYTEWSGHSFLENSNFGYWCKFRSHRFLDQSRVFVYVCDWSWVFLVCVFAVKNRLLVRVRCRSVPHWFMEQQLFLRTKLLKTSEFPIYGRRGWIIQIYLCRLLRLWVWILVALLIFTLVLFIE